MNQPSNHSSGDFRRKGDGYASDPGGFKRRVVFTPDGDSQVEFRPVRPPRPGRQERDAIRRGERPFWRNGPQGAGPARSPGGGYNSQATEPNPPSGPSGPTPYSGSRTWRNPNLQPREVRPSREPQFQNYDRPAPKFDNSGAGDRPPFAGARTWRNPKLGGVNPESGGESGRPPLRPARPGEFIPSSQRDRESSRPFSRPERSEGFEGRGNFGRPSFRRDGGNWSGEPRRGFQRPGDEARPFRPFRAERSGAPEALPDVRVARPFRAPEPPPVPVSIPEMVVGVLSKANRQVPADAALRSALKSARGISPEAAREISETVFKYYRWMGWLEPSASVASQVEHAAEIAARFARNPASFSTEELRTKAVPEWIHQELDATESWLRSLQELPQLWLRAQPGHAAALAAQLPVQSGPFDNSFRFQGSVDLFTHPLFQAGEFEIQDIASQAVGVICAPKGTEAWWDACAGEGGKTLHLSAMMGGRGTIWASDRAAWRLERLRRRTARSHCFNYRTVEWDGGAKLPTRTLFDGVLVDAPCSGVGTWGRNPHARWTTTLEDVLELAQTQQRLLAHSSAAIKPGGRLIYSVCTVTRSETTSVVEAFNREHGADFEPLPVANPFRPEAPANSQWLWWPDETGGNGMFVAAWKRKQAV